MLGSPGESTFAFFLILMSELYYVSKNDVTFCLE